MTVRPTSATCAGRPRGRGIRLSPRAKGALLLLWIAVTAVCLLCLESRQTMGRYRAWIERYAAEAGLDPDLVEAVVFAESKSRPAAVSRKGAIGLMQLMPDTAKEVGLRLGMGTIDEAKLKIPRINLRLGTEYLGWLRRRYDSLELTLAAYNAGPGRVAGWRRDHPELRPRQLIEEVAFRETRDYVARVIARYRELVAARTGSPAS